MADSDSRRPDNARRGVGWGRIFLVFLRIGATTFGGMWAAAHKLENDLVRRAGWLERKDLQGLFVVSELIPAPKFMSLGGLVGFRIRGWSGSLSAILGLVLPTSLLVVAGAALLPPDVLQGPLAPLNTSIGVAVVGLLFGNAWHQLRVSKARGRNRVVGLTLSLTLFLSIVAGVPLIAAALVGFAVGAVLIREEAGPATTEPGPR